MAFDICIFDLDGTLTDPGQGITKAYQIALSAFGIHEELDSLKRFIGPPLRDNFSKECGLSDADTEKAVEIFRDYLRKKGLYENVLCPGIPELLRQLADSGKKLAVATNKNAEMASLTVKHFQIDRYFDYISGDTNEGSLTKYGKRVIIRAVLDALDPEGEKTAVMVGDREDDIIGAKANGIDSIGIMWGYGSRAELEAAGATWVADHPGALLRLMC